MDEDDMYGGRMSDADADRMAETILRFERGARSFDVMVGLPQLQGIRRALGRLGYDTVKCDTRPGMLTATRLETPPEPDLFRQLATPPPSDPS